MSRIKGYKDECYIRGNVPMTKREIRILTIALLEVNDIDIVVDIGAGTGGLTMEAAYATPKGKVYAVETKPEAIQLIKENARQFGCDHIQLIEGRAPEALKNIETPVDKVIIGGTGGKMEDIFVWSHQAMVTGGRIVANFVTLENAAEAMAFMKKYFIEAELIQVAISRGDAIGGLTLLRAANPIFIITGKKG